MTNVEFNKLIADMESVRKLLEFSVNCKNDATEAMKFAQAALNASDAVNRKWLCLGSNKPSPREGFEMINAGDPRQGY